MKKLTNKQLKNIYKTGAFTKSNRSTKFLKLNYNVYFYLTSLLQGNKVRCYSYVLRCGRPPRCKSIASAFMAVEILKAAGYKVKLVRVAPCDSVLCIHYKLARRVNASVSSIIEQLSDAKNRGVLS